MGKKPNVLFIISDQHSHQVFDYKDYYPDVKTPNLTKLAREGVRFENCITQNPICTPSRVSFLSGQYPHNHLYYGLGGPNPDGLPTILGHFRRFGYKTGAIGKIHCPEYWVEDDTDFFREVYPGCSIGGCPEYSEYLRKKGILQDRDDRFLQEQKEKRGQSVDARVSRLKYEDSVEGWIVRESMKFMEECLVENKNFFLHVSLPRPHQNYVPSEPFWSMYKEENLSLPPNADYDMKKAKKAPHLIEAAEAYKRGDWTIFHPRTFKAGRLRKLHGYLGCVSQVDYAVGELLSFLEKKHIEEETIVIYTSDHGEYVCQHSIMEKAPGICSDAVTRIPFIWRWKGHFKQGLVVDEIVETVDLSTTLCSLAEIDLLMTSDGKDISPLLYGERKQIHNIGVTENPWSKSIRKGKYRLVIYPKEMFKDEYPEGFGELYDIEKDPWEMENLYFYPEYSQVIKEIKQAFIDWLITTTRVKTAHPLKIDFSWQVKTRFNSRINFDGKVNPEKLNKENKKGYL